MCCLCHTPYVEIHHITPEAEGGANSEDNAAPLCPSCHEILGANSMKRKQIKQARDCWYEICESRYLSDPERIDEMASRVKQAATKEDLKNAVENIIALVKAVVANPRNSPVEATDELSDVTAHFGVTLIRGYRCYRCGHEWRPSSLGSASRICPKCKSPYWDRPRKKNRTR